jgi:hypothetical protein
MLALAAISCCSAWRMSGRRVKRSDGRPAGTSLNMAPTLVTLCTSLPPEGAGLAWGGPALRPSAMDAGAGAGTSRAGGRGWPTSRVRAFRSCARRRCCCCRAARAPAVRDSAWRTSNADEAPLSSRNRVRRRESSRVFKVLWVIASSSSLVCRFSQVLATAAIRLACTARRDSSLARYCARAASFRLATRPKRSSSQPVNDSPAV